MKPKQLIPFAVILVVLAGLVFWKQSQQEAPSIVKQANLAALAPEGVTKAAVTRVVLYAGNAQEKSVVLEKSGETWRVPSHFNAPVQEDTIDGYLDMLLSIKGEHRDTANEDSQLGVYELKDDQAFHVEVHTGGDTPAFHLLVGKSPDFRSVFVRMAGGRDVYVERKDPRREAGMNASGPGLMPDAAHWFDKDIIQVDQERIERVALTMPDKSLVLERTERTPEAPAETENAEGENAESPEPQPETVWVVAAGDPGMPLKEPGVQSVLQKIATFVATDIVDPAQSAEWGLDNPAYRAEIALEGGETIVLEGGRPDPAEDAYVRLASADNGVVYKVNKFNFERLFAKGSQLFDLPKQTVAQEAMESIQISGPDGEMRLEKDGDWKLVAPESDLELQVSALNGLLSTLANLTPGDYADAGTDIGAFTHSITVVASEKAHTVRIAAPSLSTDGRYAQLDGTDAKLVLSQNDVAKLALQPRDLLNRRILALNVGDVARVDVQHGGAAYGISRGADGWVRTADGLALETDLVEDLLFALDELQVDDILPGADTAALAYDTTLALQLESGGALAVNLTAAQDGLRTLTTTTRRGAFSVKEESLAPLIGPVVAIRDAGAAQEEEPAVEAQTSEDGGETAQE